MRGGGCPPVADLDCPLGGTERAGRTERSRAGGRRQQTAILVAVLLVGLTSGSATASPASPRHWIDADGRELPFQTDEEMLEFLRTAPVTGFKQLSGGINNPYRLDLELPGFRVRAIFRDVDVTRRSGSTPAERAFPSFRDSYLYEVAAWEVSRLLGIDNVPPATLYRWRGEPGSLQLWVEQARSEAERIESGDALSDPAGWQRQRTSMIVFDNLIYNFDRNHGNQLMDEQGKLWFIDHTRSFKREPSLPDRGRLLVIDAELWNQLRSLQADEVSRVLEPYLDLPQLKALLKRQQMLVKYIEQMIEERGEAQVLLGSGGPSPLPATDD